MIEFEEPKKIDNGKNNILKKYIQNVDIITEKLYSILGNIFILFTILIVVIIFIKILIGIL